MDHLCRAFSIKIIPVLFMFIFSFMLAAENSVLNPFLLSDDTTSLFIKDGVEYFVDEQGSYSLEDVLVQDFSHQEGDINWGLTDETVWLRFRTDNQSVKERWILEFNIHKFYTTEIYSARDGDIPVLSHSWSYKQPFREREIQEPYLGFLLTVPPGSHMTFFVKVKSENSLEIPLLLHSSESYFQKTTRMKALYSTIYGILTAMFVYNIFIYFFLRDKNYLYYIVYVLVYALYLSALNGYGAKFLWPFVEGRWTTIFSAVFGGLSLGTGCYMTREFLQTRETLPGSDRVLRILAVSGLFLSLIIFIFKRFMISFIYGNLVGTIVLLGIVIVTVISFSKGYRPALYFLFSYSTIIIAQVAYSLLSLGPFGDHFFLRNLNQYAPVFQMVLLSLSLSFRFNLMRIEKDEALDAALKAEMKLASGLEEIVNERTRELKEANDKLESLTYVDPMTGLYNRRYFEKVLKAEWKRHGREGLPLSVIMCDIDNFKLYNDTKGHQAGDECIQKIAEALIQTARRESDVPVRYGGEEFILVLPQMDSDGVRHIARNVKEQVDSLQIPHPAYPGHNVSLSMGISSVVPTPENGPEILIESADKALYMSKQEGRNRITYLSS